MRYRIDSDTHFIFAVISDLANGNHAADRHK
jgi:hypothetical protein